MAEQPEAAEIAQVPTPADSHGSATSPSGKPALLREADLLQKLFWSVPETAFLMRVSVRTLWREMSNPRTHFPTPHRVRGRTLLARDAVLAYMAKEATR